MLSCLDVMYAIRYCLCVSACGCVCVSLKITKLHEWACTCGCAGTVFTLQWEVRPTGLIMCFCVALGYRCVQGTVLRSLTSHYLTGIYWITNQRCECVLVLVESQDTMCRWMATKACVCMSRSWQWQELWGACVWIGESCKVCGCVRGEAGHN